MNIQREDGRRFEFELTHVSRGEWVTNLVAVDGDHQPSSTFGPFASEQKARKACKCFADSARLDPQWGWVS